MSADSKETSPTTEQQEPLLIHHIAPSDTEDPEDGYRVSPPPARDPVAGVHYSDIRRRGLNVPLLVATFYAIASLVSVIVYLCVLDSTNRWYRRDNYRGFGIWMVVEHTFALVLVLYLALSYWFPGINNWKIRIVVERKDGYVIRL